MPDNFNWIDNNNIFTDMKHTPGPWHPIEYAGRITLQSLDEYNFDDDILDADNVGLEALHDNGKLAAAAPEMYELLSTYRLWQNDADITNWQDKVESLLNKINS